MNTNITTARVADNGTETWFTSDTHFSHQNIIRFCPDSRGKFRDTDEMDEAIINNWNSRVHPEDTVYHLGDIALGPIAKSLPKVARLNGYKIAVLGNHDRPFMREGKNDESAWWNEYREVFDEVWHWDGGIVEYDGGGILSAPTQFRLSHFPYTGDHTAEDRHSDKRPVDEGMLLIHGHTHSKDRLTASKRGTRQLHVGQDAWGMAPVSLGQVLFEFGL